MKIRKLFSLLFTVILVAALCANCSAAHTDGVDWATLYVCGDSENENTRIRPQQLQEVSTIVLPASVSAKAVPIRLDIPEGLSVTASGSAGSAEVTDGGTLDLTALCGEGEYTVTFRAGEEAYSLRFLLSANVPAMYLVSDDPDSEGRAWVESSPNKSNKATGSMVLQHPDGGIVYDGALTQIKGRGNSTWVLDKKPYQIKLEDKTDLLDTGDSDNRSKTWVLLANYLDPSLIRNRIVLDMGRAMGMDANVESEYVDLYYDGEYRGSYLLTEKVELGSGRVDITDLEEANQEANPGVDIEEFPTATGTTANGATYTYCEGMASPEDVTGGYLLEMDFGNRAIAEVSYFYTTRGNYVVVKSPEFASREEMDYIATLYQEFEDAVYSGGVNPATGKAYTDYVGLEGLVDFYLINEFAKNIDAFSSSTYLYKDAGEDMLRMSPLWDYDLSLGIGGGQGLTEEVSPIGLQTARMGLGAALFELEDFRKAAAEVYEAELYPLIREVLLGDMDAVSADGSLRSLAYYSSMVQSSAACDRALWPAESWETSAAKLEEYIDQRAENLLEIFLAPNPGSDIPLSDFLDVPADAWYCPEIQAARKYGLVNGVGGDSFAPLADSTRAQVVQVLYNMNGNPDTRVELNFTDVFTHDWYARCVTWGADTGIVLGRPDGTFAPMEPITRQDIIVLLYRYHGSPEVSSTGRLDSFADSASVADYARPAMQWALEQGILLGNTDNTLRPLTNATRAEMTALIVRFYTALVME